LIFALFLLVFSTEGHSHLMSLRGKWDKSVNQWKIWVFTCNHCIENPTRVNLHAHLICHKNSRTDWSWFADSYLSLLFIKYEKCGFLLLLPFLFSNIVVPSFEVWISRRIFEIFFDKHIFKDLWKAQLTCKLNEEYF